MLRLTLAAVSHFVRSSPISKVDSARQCLGPASQPVRSDKAACRLYSHLIYVCGSVKMRPRPPHSEKVWARSSTSGRDCVGFCYEYSPVIISIVQLSCCLTTPSFLLCPTPKFHFHFINSLNKTGFKKKVWLMPGWPSALYHA